jgi:DNA gyrase/topoisomerase IV subunit A
VDIIFKTLPYRLDTTGWWASVTLEMVNIGLLPLVGIVFWLLADWIETVSKDSNNRQASTGSLVISILSLIFGVLYFAITPYQAWYGSNARSKVFDENKTQLAAAEAQGKKSPELVKQQLARVNAQMKDSRIQGADLEQLKAAKANLEQLISNPATITNQVNKELDVIRKQFKAKEEKATLDLWQVSIRTSLDSLLLSAVSSFIGLLGLRRTKR